MNDNTNTRVKIGEVRLSYCHLFTPEAVSDGSEKKYSVALLIPKSNTKLVEEIKAGIKAAFQAGIASKFGGKQKTAYAPGRTPSAMVTPSVPTMRPTPAPTSSTRPAGQSPVSSRSSR